MASLVRASLLALSSLMLVAPSTVRAQRGTVEEARGLFEAGLAAYESERYEEALEYFERSFALEPNTAILYNAARSGPSGSGARSSCTSKSRPPRPIRRSASKPRRDSPSCGPVLRP
ncbi:MAG: tetratricopeptide repeat protein [Sandaracinaceae bacterium]